MNRQQRLKEIEDAIVNTVGTWPSLKRAVAYRYLYNLGIRINDIDMLVRSGLKEEEEKLKLSTGPI